MQPNLLMSAISAALVMRLAAPQPRSAGVPKAIPFRFLSAEERAANVERDAFNTKVNTRQVRRRLTRPWKQRVSV